MRSALSNLFDKSISKASAFVFAARLLGMFAFLAFNLLISNLGGPKLFGEFTLWIMTLNIGGMIALLGLDSYMLQKMPGLLRENKTEEINILDNSIQTYLIISIVVGGALFTLLHFMSLGFFEQKNAFFLVALVLGPFVIYRYRLECLRAQEKIQSYALLAFLSIPILCLSLYALHTFIDLDVFSNLNSLIATPINVYALSILITTFLVLIVWKRKAVDLGQAGNKINMAPIIKQAIPFMFIAVLMFFNEWVDKFMLKLLSSTEQVGLYSAAYRIIQLAALPLISINAIAAPKFAASFKLDSKFKFRNLVNTTTHLIILSSIPILLIIFLFPESMLSVFGGEFKIAKQTLIILCIAQCFNVFCGPVGILLKMTERQNILFLIVFLSVLINIILNLILIPKLGLNGAGIATATSIILINIISLFYIKKEFGFFTFQRKASE